MTPGNYCIHAIEDLAKERDFIEARGSHDDAVYLDMMVDDLQRATKFLLPTNGRLLNQEQDFSLIDKQLRLPFKYLAAEYNVILPQHHLKEGQLGSTKRIVYCMETDAQQGYWTTTVDYIDSLGVWVACPVMVYISYTDIATDLQKNAKMGWLGKVQYQLMMPDAFEYACRSNKSIMPAERMTRTFQELLWDWESIVHLTNFLGCSNAETETLRPSPKLNSKRVAHGKLPFHEYKVLKVRSAQPHNARTGATVIGGHASPRQHVRRGHIRHYGPNEKRSDATKRAGYTLWIEQMLVGDPAIGKIEKDYALR